MPRASPGPSSTAPGSKPSSERCARRTGAKRRRRVRRARSRSTASLIDLRHAIRALRATPSFTIGALLVLALGTGATTAIFSVVDAVALRPLPFPDPRPHRRGGGARGRGRRRRWGTTAARARLIARPGGPVPGGGPQGGPRPLWAMPGAKLPEPDALMSVTSQDYLDWAAQQQVFESMAAIVDTGDTVLQRPDAELEIVKGQRVTASFFDVLRARPMLGAAFTSQNEARRQRPRGRGEPWFLAAVLRRRSLSRWPLPRAQ